jgi:hypothetical protein
MNDIYFSPNKNRMFLNKSSKAHFFPKDSLTAMTLIVMKSTASYFVHLEFGGIILAQVYAALKNDRDH